MSTLADLINNRISLNRKLLLIEKLSDNYIIYIINRKGEEPLDVSVFLIEKSSLLNLLSEKNITKEDIYLILHPSFYYKNSIQLPFTDVQKIEDVINNEVMDYLPFSYESNETNIEPDLDFIVDFDFSNRKIITYTVELKVLKDILSDLGDYADNLKAVIPYGALLRNFFTEKISRDSLKKLILIECNSGGIEVWGLSNNDNGEIIYIINDLDNNKRDNFTSALLRLKKYYQDNRYVYIIKPGCKESLIDPEEDSKEDSKIGSDLMSVQLNFGNYLHGLKKYKVDKKYELTLYGFLWFLQKNDKKVNLLKGPYKPSLKNYIRVKDIIIVAVLLVVFFGFSVSRFFTDISSLKNRVVQLKKEISFLTEKTFGRKITSVRSAVKLLTDLKSKDELLEKYVNRKYSALEIFKEFTSAMPVDVELEYTDILIDQNRIRFNGKTKSFADIDKIKKSLQSSDYFKEVNVTNSGTTGSTGGFIVNFQFDIKCAIK